MIASVPGGQIVLGQYDGVSVRISLTVNSLHRNVQDDSLIGDKNYVTQV